MAFDSVVNQLYSFPFVCAFACLTLQYEQNLFHKYKYTETDITRGVGIKIYLIIHHEEDYMSEICIITIKY